MNRKYLFTVDQLELIRRLRNSGLTKEQVLCAFDSFERLDNRVGTSLSIPVTLQTLQAQALQRLALAVPSAVGIGNTAVANPDNQPQQAQHRPEQQLPLQQPVQQPVQPPVQQHVQQQHLQQLQQQLLQKLSQQQSLQKQQWQNAASENFQMPNRKSQQQQQQLNDVMLSKSVSNSGTVTDNSSNSEDGMSIMGRTVEGEEGEIDSDELREFISQGEVGCLEEIKDFILKHNIKQQQIAILAGVSQPYVSRYLRADFNSMSERSCRAIKKWYLAYRKNPMAIGPAANSAVMMNGGTGGPPTLKKLISQASLDFTCFASSPSVENELEVLNYPRRERFVFRPNHLQILERFFLDDNYPSYDKREDIAKMCNESTKELVGRELTEREKVTVQIVSNWFANKRKDLKKLYKEEGLDASQVPMRSRGRPSHNYLDNSSVLLQSALDHQNQQVVHLLQENGAHSVERPVGNDDHLISDCITDAKSDQHPTVDEAAALQFSVEMAAVNQAIMSLTGQEPINIKMEKADISDYLAAGQSRLNAQASCVAANMS